MKINKNIYNNISCRFKNANNNYIKIQNNFPFKSNKQYSIENLKANYLVNFRGKLGIQTTSDNGINVLNHQTQFFREPEIDEAVQNYILKLFSNDSEINVVSGACSSGEEAKSYAMMLDSLGDRLHVFGFDISEDIIREAKSKTARLILDVSNNCQANEFFNFSAEKYLVDDSSPFVTPYQQKCRQKFISRFDKSGEKQKLPVYPNAQEELNKLNEILSNKEKYMKAKSDFESQMEKMAKSLADSGNSNYFASLIKVDFESSCLSNKKMFERQLGQFYTVQDFKAKEGAFDNCEFKKGDVLELEKLYKPKSINVLLYRNALYHTLCKGYNLVRKTQDNAQEKMNSIARQMNKVLKFGGLVVFGKNEWLQGVDENIIRRAMESNGFTKYVNNLSGTDCIWLKYEDVE